MQSEGWMRSTWWLHSIRRSITQRHRDAAQNTRTKKISIVLPRPSVNYELLAQVSAPLQEKCLIQLMPIYSRFVKYDITHLLNNDVTPHFQTPVKWLSVLHSASMSQP